MNKFKKKFYHAIFCFLLIFCVEINCLYGLSWAENAAVEVLFSPGQDCAQHIIDKIAKAQETILIAMYTFTSKSLAQSLASAQARGVKIKICLEGENAQNKYSQVKFLAEQGIKIKLIFGQGIMHHKFCIIDDFTLLTGSFNWTASADLRNDENILFIESSNLAEKFKTEFQKLWEGKKIDAYAYKSPQGTAKTLLPGEVFTVDFDEINTVWIGNRKNKKLHKFNCPWARKMNAKNKIFFKSNAVAKKQGFLPCKSCNP